MGKYSTRVASACAVVLSLAAAACGSSATPKSAATAPTTAPVTTATTAAASSPTASGSTAAPAVDATAAANGGITVTSADGAGADNMLARLQAGKTTPLKATGDPYVIGLTNDEGDPAINIPEARTGVELAVDYIDNVLGGVGADPAKGTPGRPLKLVSCPHTLDAGQATACANQIAQAKPVAAMFGVEAFSSVMYPAWSGFPVLGLVPIVEQDYNQPNVFNLDSGNLQNAGATQQIIAKMEAAGSKKMAVIVADNGGSSDYATSFATKVATLYQKTHADFGYQVFKYSGAADVTGAVQGAIDFGAQALWLPLGPPDCDRVWGALDQQGYTGLVYSPASCLEDKILQAHSGFLTKVKAVFGITTYDMREPALYSTGSLVQFELQTRLDLFAAKGQEITTFGGQNFANTMFLFNVMDIQAKSGGTIDGPTLSKLFAAPNLHLFGASVTNCGSISGLSTICNAGIGFLMYDAGKLVPLDAKTDLISMVDVAESTGY